MSEEILVILKVMSLIVYSGNIVNWNRLKRYLNYGVIVEVIFCLFISFKNSIEVNVIVIFKLCLIIYDI